MSAQALLALALLAAPSQDGGTLQDPGPVGDGPQKKPGTAVVPESAAEGPRDLDAATAAVKRIVAEQPYGKTWRELVKTEPPPKDPKGLGQSKTHPALSKDKIEMQEQVQYLDPTGDGTRYGWVSVQAVRVFRYGKLNGVLLLVEKIGKQTGDADFHNDARALADAWKDAAAALALGDAFVVKRNDLAAAELKKPPLKIEIEKAKKEKK